MSQVSNTFVMTNNSKVSKKQVNNYRILRKLGEGSFAKVRLVQDVNSGQKYAMKQMNK